MNALNEYYEKFLLDNWKMEGSLFEYENTLPITAVVLYLIMINVLPKMINKRIDVNFFATIWNLFLSLFSGVCFYFCFFTWKGLIEKYGFWEAFCSSKLLFSQPNLLFWCKLFAYSKYFELVDTILLILKKKEVEFLHWWHHFTVNLIFKKKVLLFTWYAIAFGMGAGSVFAMVNAFVHLFMYFYYFLTCIGIYPSWGIFLTILQISQMFLGIFLCYSFFILEKCDCRNRTILLVSCLIMYGSYLILFLKFFFEKYILKSKDKKRNDQTKDDKKKDDKKKDDKKKE
jgi:elongation of very long chain fatty acids protein 6